MICLGTWKWICTRQLQFGHYLTACRPSGQGFRFFLFLIYFYKKNWLHSLADFVNFIICKVLAGDIDPAVRTHAAFFSVWKKYGFTPEGFNLATFSVQVLCSSCWCVLLLNCFRCIYWIFAICFPSTIIGCCLQLIEELGYPIFCSLWKLQWAHKFPNQVFQLTVDHILIFENNGIS